MNFIIYNEFKKLLIFCKGYEHQIRRDAVELWIKRHKFSIIIYINHMHVITYRYDLLI